MEALARLLLLRGDRVCVLEPSLALTLLLDDERCYIVSLQSLVGPIEAVAEPPDVTADPHGLQPLAFLPLTIWGDRIGIRRRGPRLRRGPGFTPNSTPSFEATS